MERKTERKRAKKMLDEIANMITAVVYRGELEMKKLSPFDRFVFGFGVALSAGFFALVVLLVSGAMPPDCAGGLLTVFSFVVVPVILVYTIRRVCSLGRFDR